MSEPDNISRMTRITRMIDHYLDRGINGITLLAVHEADSLRGHWSALRERWSVAQRARSTGELIRDQVDLLPESRNRVLQDQVVRKQLWRGWIRDLNARVQKLG